MTMGAVQRASSVGQVVLGTLMLLFGLTVGGVCVADVLHGKVDSGTYGALIFLLGVTLIGAFLGHRGVRQLGAADRDEAHQRELQLLRALSVHGGRASTPELAVSLGLSPAEIEPIADRLARQGHLSVLVSPEGVIVHEARGLRLSADERQQAEDPLAPRVGVRVSPPSAAPTDDELLAAEAALDQRRTGQRRL